MDWDSLESDWAFQKLWSILAPSNPLCLRWRVLIDRIQTNVNLVRRHISLPDAGCPMCMLALESTNHLFFSCYFTWRVWAMVAAWLGWQCVFSEVALDHFHQFVGDQTLRIGKGLAVICMAVFDSCG